MAMLIHLPWLLSFSRWNKLRKGRWLATFVQLVTESQTQPLSQPWHSADFMPLVHNCAPECTATGEARSSIFSWRLCLCLFLQSRLTLCDPMDCSQPGSSVPGILQARILEWVAMPSSRGSSQPREHTQISHIAGGFFTIWATREDGLLEPGNPETVQLEGTISSNIGNVIPNFSVPWRFIGLTDFCIFYIFQFSSSCIYLEADTENSFNANLQKRKNKDSEFSLTLFGPQENKLLKAIHLVSDKTLTSTQPF